MLNLDLIRTILTEALGGDLGTYTTQGGDSIPAISVDDGTDRPDEDWEAIEGIQVMIILDLNPRKIPLLNNAALMTERANIVLGQHTPGGQILEPTLAAMAALQKNYPNLLVEQPQGSRARQRLDSVPSMVFPVSLTIHRPA